MRATHWIIAAVTVIVAIWTGCDSETNTSTTSSTSSGSSSSGSLCVGKGVDVFKGDCGLCANEHCVKEVSACNVTNAFCAARGCAECLQGINTSCTEKNTPFVDTAYECLLTNCKASCFPLPDELACGSDVSTAMNTPSGGACGNNLGECNPVTNSPCDTAGGFACDVAMSGANMFSCYGPPNTAGLCEPCDGSTFCRAGTTCIDTEVGARCARFCCADEDCGAQGKCLIESANVSVGLCVPNGSGTGGGGGAGGMGSSSSSSGMGGAGGAGGAGDMDAGADPDSGSNPADASADSGDGG